MVIFVEDLMINKLKNKLKKYITKSSETPNSITQDEISEIADMMAITLSYLLYLYQSYKCIYLFKEYFYGHTEKIIIRDSTGHDEIKEYRIYIKTIQYSCLYP